MNNYWDNVVTGNKDYYYGDYDNLARLLALKLIKDGEWLLDIGSGNGMMYELLMKHNRQVRIFYKGIDYSEKMIQNCRNRWKGISCFEQYDVAELDKLPREHDPIKEYDTIYIRHCLENIRDWKKAITDMFRLAKKRVIIDMRRPLVNYESKMIEDLEDTVVWDINYDEFNILCRNLTVNVSYLQKEIGDSNTIVVLGKKLDDVVFTLDDFHETNHRLDLLLKLKEDYPKMKVTLFTIPSKCSVKWLKDLKEKYGDWMQFAVHGWFHDVSNREHQPELYPEECKNWTKEDAHKYLQMAENMGVFVNGFKAPGWGTSQGTYEALAERGYWIMEHKDHERYEDIKLPRYTTGSLFEVNGHIQFTAFNGLEEMVQRKLNFAESTEFHFVEDVLGRKDIYLQNLI